MVSHGGAALLAENALTNIWITKAANDVAFPFFRWKLVEHAATKYLAVVQRMIAVLEPLSGFNNDRLFSIAKVLTHLKAP
jgi:hypothetical protein